MIVKIWTTVLYFCCYIRHLRHLMFIQRAVKLQKWWNGNQWTFSPEFPLAFFFSQSQLDSFEYSFREEYDVCFFNKYTYTHFRYMCVYTFIQVYIYTHIYTHVYSLHMYIFSCVHLYTHAHIMSFGSFSDC